MIEMTLKFNSMKDIEDFHRVACKMNCDVDALKGSYIVDAKSFMALLTMDYSTPLTIKIHSNDLSLRERFREWI